MKTQTIPQSVHERIENEWRQMREAQAAQPKPASAANIR